MSEDVRRMVGRNVRRLRIAAGLSQAQLAERMGVDRAYVSGLELGQRNPSDYALAYRKGSRGEASAVFWRKRRRVAAVGGESPGQLLQEAAGLAGLPRPPRHRAIACSLRDSLISRLLREGDGHSFHGEAPYLRAA
jgi:DNA-binding XRE family transcriptional regulator